MTPDPHSCEVISIGDELLIGQVVNTNQADIARSVNEIGLSVTRMVTVGDEPDAIVQALDRASRRSAVAFVTGGLGPTHDDITRGAVCTFLSCGLVRHEPTLSHITEIFSRRGLALSRLNEDQALIPEAVEVIPNRLGTAPGYTFSRNAARFFVMPGVPYEMRSMMKESILPMLTSGSAGRVVCHRTIKTTGIAESHLAERLGDTKELLLNQESLRMAYLPSPLGVRLRITGTGTNAAAVRSAIARAEENIVARIPTFVYGYDDDEIESIVGELLRQRGQRIAVAESCTGGLILDRLTDIPGSSDYVERGFVCYSNASKVSELGVPQELIDAHGAVSSEVAVAMAQGARAASGADVAVSTTGIAGPTGGTDEKPVGLVFIGYAEEGNALALRFTFGNDRRRVKERATQAALNLLRRKLLAS